jgi:hypothetical protein
MLKLLAIAAMLASPAANPPAVSNCLTRQQIGDISVVTMASMVETARNACRPHLPATAFLGTPAAAEFSGRLRAEARQRLISAVAAISRMTPTRGVTPEAMRSLTEQGLAEGTGAEFSAFLNPAICGDISEIMEISAELSPDQMGRFFGAFGSLIDNLIRVLPPGLLGPGGPSIPPPPPGARPASFDLLRPAPSPVPETSKPPIQPFLCRTPE